MLGNFRKSKSIMKKMKLAYLV